MPTSRKVIASFVNTTNCISKFPRRECLTTLPAGTETFPFQLHAGDILVLDRIQGPLSDGFHLLGEEF